MLGFSVLTVEIQRVNVRKYNEMSTTNEISISEYIGRQMKFYIW